MKRNILYIFVCFALLISFGACDDFLDVEQKSKITSDELFSSDGGINSYMAGLYCMLPMEDFRYMFTKSSGAYSNTRMDGGWTNMASGPEAVHCEWGDYAGQSDRYNNWDEIYNAVRKYNELKENIPLMKPTNQETLKTVRGEYHFFMAYSYFALARRYGGVPIITDVQQFTGDYEAVKVPRSKEIDTWKFILAECDSAIALLPNSTIQERANKWTAYTLKSRAALHAASTGKFWSRDGAALTGLAVTQGLVGGFTADDTRFFYQECINACAEVIKSGKFSLYGESPATLEEAANNYHSLFVSGTGIPEVIFIRRFIYPGLAHSIGRWLEPNQLAVEYAGRCCPTLEMVESYAKIDPATRKGAYNVKFETTADGAEDYTVGYSFNNNHNYKRYDNMSEIFADRDPRLYATVILPNSSWGGKTILIQGGIVKEDGSAIWQTNDKYTFNGTDYYGLGNSNTKEISGWPLNGNNGTRTGFLLKKYLTGQNDQVYDQQTTPFTEYRYADILMNYAEAVSESGLPDAPGIITAQEALNKIRKRAGFSDEVSLTPEIVQYERKAEFGLEYSRVWEYSRRREFHTFFNNTYRRKGLIPLLDFSTGSPKYIFVRADAEAANGNAKIFEPKTYYRPIPGIEGNSLVQNPNY